MEEVPEITGWMERHPELCEPLRHVARNPSWRILVDYDFVDEAAIARSPFYALMNEFDAVYRLGIRLVDEPAVSKALVVSWPKSHGHATRDDVERLGRIARPLRIAAQCVDRISASLDRELGILDGLALSSTAACLMDADGRLVAANDPMRTILLDEDGISSAGARLTPADPAARRALRAWLGRFGAGSAEPSDAALALAVPRPSGSPSYVLRLIALPPEQQFVGGTRKLALGLLDDPSPSHAPCGRLLVSLFGLTAAEAEIAAAFARGLDLRAIAGERRTGEETVRKQVKTLIAKLGLRGQRDLATFLAAMPAATPGIGEEQASAPGRSAGRRG